MGKLKRRHSNFDEHIKRLKQNAKTTEESNQCERQIQSEEGENEASNVSRGTTPSNIAIVGTSGDNKSPPQMFELNFDCFEHLFSWLSLKELLTLRRTCKRIKQAVDDYIKWQYPKLRYSNLGEFTPYSTWPKHLQWCKHLQISTWNWNDTKNENIKHVLNQLETLKLNHSKIDGDLYEVLLKYCPRLKRLSVISSRVPELIAGPGCQWLHRSYPTLEYFKIDIYSSATSRQCPELLVFFERNPNIRTFATNSSFLLMNRQLMLNSTLKFDRLYIEMNHDFNVICSLVGDLFKRGIFKKLHLESRYNYSIGQLDGYHSIDYLEMLNVFTLSADIPVTKMNSLKELRIRSSLDFCKLATRNLINLRSIYIPYTCVDVIYELVSHAPKLEQITIERGIESVLRTRDLVALNEAREKLAEARKVTIFFPEKEFLFIKWAAKMDFSLIKFRRFESCEKDHTFEWW